MELMVGNESVAVPFGDGELDVRLWLPSGASGLVVLAGENTRQRLRPTGDYLPSVFGEANLATLVIDACAVQPAHASAEMLAAGVRECVHRVYAVLEWARRQDALAELPVGLVGIGKGAAPVLDCGAQLGRELRVMAARSMHCPPGQADITRISAPTLLIAGGLDQDGVRNSRLAYGALCCHKRFEIVPGATRAFDEPGSLEVVARLVRSWLMQHLH